MINNNNNNDKDRLQVPEVCKNPIDLGKKNIQDLIEEFDKKLAKTTFMSGCNIPYNSNECILPQQNKFFFSRKNRIFVANIKKDMIAISLKTNFIISDIKECTNVYNDKGNNKPYKYYLITLISSNGKVEKDVMISGSAKSDYKQFQKDLDAKCNGFKIDMKETEFKAFADEFISSKVVDNITVYSNAGVLEPGKILYKNALATSNNIYFVDEDGYIRINDSTCIKVADSTHFLPVLSESNKNGKEVVKDLMNNIIECWSDNIVLPLVVLGHMVMSIYFADFVKKFGVPTLILFGSTGSGKSTLTTVGVSICGLYKSALTSGGSTAKSNEYLCSKYNGLNVCIDDVKGETLNSSTFTTLIKGAYKAIPRTKMLPYGKGIEYIQICSPLVYSTNEALPSLKEVINRMNVVEIFNGVFKAEKFKYHENNIENLEELSLILPEFLKYSFNNVEPIYESIFNDLKENTKDTQLRVISNLAYAYTGISLLLKVSGVNIDGLRTKLIEYAKDQVIKYEDIKNVVDEVLSEIYVLYKIGQIQRDVHFRIKTVLTNNNTSENHLCFNKGVILALINKYYAHDKSKRIDIRLFNSYIKNHPRYRGHTTTRINLEPADAVYFNVTGLSEYDELCQDTESELPQQQDYSNYNILF